MIEKLVEVAELSRVGRDIIIQPDPKPDLHVYLQYLNCVEDHFGLVTVCAVETKLIGKSGHDGDIAGYVVLRWRILKACNRLVGDAE